VRASRLLDFLLLAALLVFAFLVASFPAANSDLLGHLALGRLWTEGKYHFGEEPFTWNGEQSYWVNPSWLFDVCAYWLYQHDGYDGALLVALKALAVAIVAGLMVATGRRPGRSLAVPVACAALAVLTMSPRLYVQPACVSLLLLGLTLWLLRRPRLWQERAGGAVAPSYLSFWLLPPVFALWANLDDWFLLGPLAVLLYLVGGLLEGNEGRADERHAGERRTLTTALVVGLAACCINPFGIYVFQLPEQLGLSAGARAVAAEGLSQRYSLSPLDSAYWAQPGVGLSIAGLAFFPLLLLGLASFVLAARGPFGGRALRDWRLPLWLVFSLMAVYTIRAIPLFAVVAAPVMALNFLDLPARRATGQPTIKRLRWSVALRAALLVVAVAAAVAAWPGWLQAVPHDTRHVGWQLAPDPSLQRAAVQIKAWRDNDLLPAGARWFNLSPEAAEYLAWYAPGEKAFLDTRLQHCPLAVRDVAQVRQALASPQLADAAAEPAWEHVFRERQVESPLLILHLRDGRSLAMAATVLSTPADWVPCRLDGSVAIVAYSGGPNAAGRYRKLRLDFFRLAFGPAAEPVSVSAPEWPAEPRAWWQELWSPPRPADPGVQEAAMHLMRFQAQQVHFDRRHSRAWRAMWPATLAAMMAAPENAVRVGLMQLPGVAAPLHDRYVETEDRGPVESLYLGIRAARRAQAANPDDPWAYLRLGKLYSLLWQSTREQVLGRDLPALAEIRRNQVAGALNEGLRLGSPLPPVTAWEAHGILAEVYRRQGYVDLWAQQLHQRFDAEQGMGRQGSEKPEDFAKRLSNAQKQLDAIDQELERRRNSYEVNAANKSVLEKAQVALGHGLAETAVDLLRNADPSALADPRTGALVGRTRAIELLLNIGRLSEARELLNPEDQPIEPTAARADAALHLRLAAVMGDYDRADAFLQLDLPADEAPAAPGRPAALSPAAAIGLDLGGLVLREATAATGASPALQPVLPHFFFQPLPYPWPRMFVLGQVANSAATTAEFRAEFWVVRAWLALEAGDNSRAESALRAAARWLPPLKALGAARPNDPALARIAAAVEMHKRCQGWLDAAR
jgi:hypothetical protein